MLGVLPFFHSFGYTVTLWTPLQVGASTVYHADPRQAREIGELARTHRCTIYLTTPTFLRFCLKQLRAGGLRELAPADLRSREAAAVAGQRFPGESLAFCRWRAMAARSYRRWPSTNLPDEEQAGVTRSRQQARHHRPADPRRGGPHCPSGNARGAADRARRACCSSTAPT